MKKILCCALGVGLLAAGSAQAAVLAGYDFTTDTSASTLKAGVTADAVVEGGGVEAGTLSTAIGDTTGLAASGTTFGSTDSGSYGVSSVFTLRQSSLAAAIEADDYYTVTITADTAGTLTITGFSLNTSVASTANGRCADEFNILAQVDGGDSWSASDALLGSDGLTAAVQSSTEWTDTFIDLSGNSTFRGIDSVEFRIYLWGGSGSATSSSRTNIDQLLIEGSIPTLSLISITPK